MGGQASAPVGTELAGPVSEPGPPPDRRYAPLPADADPDRAWIEEGLRRALAWASYPPWSRCWSWSQSARIPWRGGSAR